ncbi:FMN reductase [Lewinellaceae bacterium SD302]|nr:FMN reductase [Lewinellaceae bacterium SD302]
MPTLILHASARSNGNTWQVARRLSKELNADLVDLANYEIGFFRYDQSYPDTDDFIDFIEAKLLNYDEIVFASPVYWYTMSAQMKVFLDRISDLLKSHKDLGRRLRGKQMSVLSCANDAGSYEIFFLPFRLSADYLGMNYGQEWHGWVDDKEVKLIRL